jgi:mono/diheme cytochrome c family protein
VAPPLDDSGHGWHHADAQLAQTIREGSPRNERMIAWKDLLDGEAVRNVVAYVKSLWSFRSLACQGRRHMRCMH